MQDPSVPVSAPKQGLLGVCAAIGEDFGLNPEYLRVALVIAMLWNAYYVATGYLALGAVVAVSRWLVPSARTAATTPLAKAPAAEDAPAFEYAQAA